MIKLVALCIALFLTSCSSVNYYRMDDFEVKLALQNKEYDKAIKELSLRYNEANVNDKLLILLNLGVIYHYDKQYKKSNEKLLLAKQYIEFSSDSLKTKAIHSIISDDIGRHSLELHEELFVFSLISLNYALMDNMNDALVEAKFYDKYLSSKTNEFFSSKDNMYLSYLSGIYYQNKGMYYDSLIDYKRVESNCPDFPYIGFDLYQNYRFIGNKESHNIMEKYRISASIANTIVDNRTEVIVVFMNGLGPYKTKQPNYPKVPQYKGRNARYSNINVSVNGESYGPTIPFYNVEQSAIDQLEKSYRSLVIKDLKRMGTQALISIPIDIMSAGLGLVSHALLHGNSSSNFRYWEYMPKEVQISRIKLSPGTHTIVANYADGTVEKEIVKLSKNEIKFIEFRSQR